MSHLIEPGVIETRMYENASKHGISLARYSIGSFTKMIKCVLVDSSTYIYLRLTVFLLFRPAGYGSGVLSLEANKTSNLKAVLGI